VRNLTDLRHINNRNKPCVVIHKSVIPDPFWFINGYSLQIIAYLANNSTIFLLLFRE